MKRCRLCGCPVNEKEEYCNECGSFLINCDYGTSTMGKRVGLHAVSAVEHDSFKVGKLALLSSFVFLAVYACMMVL